MDLQLGRDLAGQAGDAHILHNDRVGSGLGDRSQRAGSLLKLVVEDQRVESYIALCAALVQVAHHFRQLGERKAYLGPRTKMLQPEVDRISPGLDRGVQLGPVASRTHHFGLDQWFHELVNG